MTKRRSLTLRVCLLFSIAGMLLQGCPEAVFLADDNLEALIRWEVGRRFGFLDQSDMLSLQVLKAQNLEIRDLSGLQYALNLLTLDVSNDSKPLVGISDISPLAELTSLNSLNLANNDIWNLNPIRSMRSLDVLILYGNHDVVDLEPIVALASLGTLKTVFLSRASFELDGELTENAAKQVALLENDGVVVVWERDDGASEEPVAVP